MQRRVHEIRSMISFFDLSIPILAILACRVLTMFVFSIRYNDDSLIPLHAGCHVSKTISHIPAFTRDNQ